MDVQYTEIYIIVHNCFTQNLYLYDIVSYKLLCYRLVPISLELMQVNNKQ